jgi:hypothetical protein
VLLTIASVCRGFRPLGVAAVSQKVLPRRAAHANRRPKSATAFSFKYRVVGQLRGMIKRAVCHIRCWRALDGHGSVDVCMCARVACCDVELWWSGFVSVDSAVHSAP